MQVYQTSTDDSAIAAYVPNTANNSTIKVKFDCSVSDLVIAVNTVQKAVGSKSTMQILDGILVEAFDNLKLTGYNQQIGIEYFPSAEIIQKGSFVVNSRLFGDIVRRLPDARVTIQVIGNVVIIDCLMCHFELAEIAPDTYPSLPKIESGTVVIISENRLKECIRGTLFAVGTDETKKAFTGSLFDFCQNTLNIVAIDGYRMALRKTYCELEGDEQSVLLPGSTLHELVKILSDDEKEIRMVLTKSLVSIEMPKCKIITRLLEGEFLNYKNILPEYLDLKVKINTNSFIASLERALLISVDGNKYPVIFRFSEDKMIITSVAQVGFVKEEIQCEIIGSAMEIAFNVRYYIEALRSIPDDFVWLNFTSSFGPATIKGIEDDNYVYMILPVRPDTFENGEDTGAGDYN